MVRKLSFCLSVLALAWFVLPSFADDKDKDNTHQGTIVSVGDNKIVMKGKDDTEHSHTLSTDAKITCDGKTCKLNDLKPGQKVRVTTKKGDKTIATKIEALDKDKNFSQIDTTTGSDKNKDRNR